MELKKDPDSIIIKEIINIASAVPGTTAVWSSTTGSHMDKEMPVIAWALCKGDYTPVSTQDRLIQDEEDISCLTAIVMHDGELLLAERGVMPMYKFSKYTCSGT